MEDLFGKKLEEARTKQGITLRQASEALKIRSDFLLAFENEHGDIPLPDVYKRGFIKLYARYLKLDPEEIAEAFSNHQRQITKQVLTGPKKEEKEILGRMAINEPYTTSLNYNERFENNQTTLPLEEEKKSSTTHTAPKKTIQGNNVTSSAKRFNFKLPSWGLGAHQRIYLKIGIIFGGSLLVFLLATLTFKGFSSSSNAKGIDKQRFLDKPSEGNLATYQKLTSPSTLEQLTLNGEENIHVIVRQENDKQKLFAGYVDAQNPVTITRKGPVKVHFSNGSALSILKADGKVIKPKKDGVGWIEI